MLCHNNPFVTVYSAYELYTVTNYHLVKCFSIVYNDNIIIRSAKMPERTDWEAMARGIIRAEMAKQNITYLQLVEKLDSIGVQEDERNLRNKVSRGKFTAAFMLQCLGALRTSQLHLD